MATRPILHSFPAPSTSLLRSFARSFSSTPSLFKPKQGINKEKLAKEKLKRKQKRHPKYKQHDVKEIEQFALCDAIRYIRAFEVGRPPRVPKYECHVRLRTKRDGPVIRNQIRLPHTVKTDLKIAVICPPDSPAAKAARDAGAALVGEEEIFEIFKTGKIDVDRCIAQPASLPKLNQAGLGRILGPRGLMPSPKLGTVVENVGTAVKTMLGGSMYRERRGVVSMAVGQLGFTPESLRDNVKAFIEQIKRDITNISEQATKEIHEVVLSSTNSPGFSLNGEFKSDKTPPLDQLSQG